MSLDLLGLRGQHLELPHVVRGGALLDDGGERHGRHAEQEDQNRSEGTGQPGTDGESPHVVCPSLVEAGDAAK
jgi:hypothetical protein